MRHEELDKALRAMPFAIQTYWHVLTGVPCSGKTTMIEMLTDCILNTLIEGGLL